MTDMAEWAEEMNLLSQVDASVDIVAVVGLDGDLEEGVLQSPAEIAVVRTGALDAKLAEDIKHLNRDRIFPVVIVTDDLGSQNMERAAGARVSVLTPSSRGMTDLTAVLKWSQAQSSSVGELRRKLHRVETKLAERTDVERAKGVIMKSRGIDEDAAYRLMRNQAMQRGMSMAKIARAVHDSAALLH